jgi:hypothetical protein
MGIVYYYEIRPLKTFSLDITKELCGNISEAVLHIEFAGVKLDLKLKSPKVPSIPSMTVKEFFNSITPESVNSFKIYGKQYNPNTILWHMEIWKDSPIKTVHCSAIDGLPKEGWKNRSTPDNDCILHD